MTLQTGRKQWWQAALLSAAFGAMSLTALVAGPASAQGLPSLGEADGFTVGDERRLGDQIVRQLYRDPDYIDDPVLQEYVENIWQALMQSARQTGALGDSLDEQFAWQVLLGKDRAVNAFALPGGYFGINLGLINVVESKDELASVMAHELSHVSQRHISRMVAQNARQTPLVIAGMILGALAASKSPDAAQAVMMGGQALAIQNSINFTRSMEQEADRIGYGLMAPAGFEPRGFVQMFDKLYRVTRLNDSGAYPYLRTHPLSSQRLSDIQARMPDSRDVNAIAPSMEHAQVVARSRILSLGTVDYLRNAVQAAQYLQRVETQPTQEERVNRLYAGAMAAMQLRDFDAAKGWASELTDITKADAKAHRLAVLLSLEVALTARDKQAIEAAYSQLSSKEVDRPELFLRTTRVVDHLGLDASLASQWQSWLVTHPRDAGAWQQLARVWQVQNQPLRAIRAEAEAQVMRYDYDAAVDRFKAAQTMVRNLGAQADHVEASIIQSRLTAVEQLRKERELALKQK